jgi:tRNA dimethylallyltransferase
LDIGSAKITPQEMQGIPHHLIDLADPSHMFTVTEYQSAAWEKIDELFSKQYTPIICGGTGMYISSVIDRVDFPQVPPNPALRAELSSLSTEELFTKLQELDPQRAANIDAKNPRRLVRALEVSMFQGEGFTNSALSPNPSNLQISSSSNPSISQEPESLSAFPNPSVLAEPRTAPLAKGSDFSVLMIGLTLPKEELVERIKLRIEQRIPVLFDEITRLHDEGISWERLESFGLEYRHGADYVRGLIDLETFKEVLATKTWQFVKRQMTWLKRDERIHWLNPLLEQEKILKLVQDFLQE